MSISAPKTARLTLIAQGQQTEEVAHISSFAIIENENKKILLVKRLRPESSAGKWLLPSAIINFGEPPEEAIKRIVKEQTGAEANLIKLLDVQSWGDKHGDICFVYGVSIGDVGRLSPDIEKAEYFDRGSSHRNFVATTWKFLKASRATQ